MFEFKREKNGNSVDISINGRFTPEHQAAADNFLQIYEFDKIIFHENQGKLLTKNLRKCRFCEKSFPEVTFKKIAHTIPQIMGNSKIINDFECDMCNELFSKYENDLANFIGLSRTLSFLKGQNGLPTFKSPDKKLIVEQDNSSIKKIRVISDGNGTANFKVDEEKKQLIFNSIRHPYTPLKVFKILLKIGYSFLDKNEIQKYKEIPKILLSDKYDENLKTHSYFRLFGCFMPGIPYPSPIVIRFCKKIDKAMINSPQQGYLIYFHNYIYQFFMPFCDNDKWMFGNNKQIKFNIMAPLIDENWTKYYGKPTYYNMDLSSNEVKKNDPQTINMTFENSIINK